MLPVCTIKKKYDPKLYVLILIMIQRKKGYFMQQPYSLHSSLHEECGEYKCEKPAENLLGKIMVPIIKYIYSKSVCYFCDYWCYPVCDSCLYKFHEKNCGCNRTEFFYNILGSQLVFCDKITKQDRIFYFW
jgi:hypothetical protein